MENPVVLGVDIGGSHITAALVDINKGILLNNESVRNSVNPEGTADEIINSWCAVIQKALSNIEITNAAIGIAMPGPFDYEEGISLIQQQKKYRSLYGLNVKRLLATKLNIDIKKICFVNDACSFLNGEVLGGIVKNEQQVIGITLGTGLGSAVYHHGSLTDAALWNEKFQSGIAEDYLSTRWFTKAYKEQSGQDISGVKELAALNETDESIQQIFDAFGKNLGLFLFDMCQKNNCKTVVIGGNISKAANLFLPATLALLSKVADKPEIKISTLGEAAAIIGAAAAFRKKDLHHVNGNQMSFAKVFQESKKM